MLVFVKVHLDEVCVQGVWDGELNLKLFLFPFGLYHALVFCSINIGIKEQQKVVNCRLNLRIKSLFKNICS